MKMPKDINLLSFDTNDLSKGPYAPNGFLPVSEGAVGNGDVYGLYWPLGREHKDPLVCDTLHDCWGMRVNFSNVKVFLLWLERYEDWLDDALDDGSFNGDYNDEEDEQATEIRLEDDPHFARTYFLQAKECLKEKRLDAAVPLLQKACDQLPEVSEYWSTLAKQLRRQNKSDEALDALINAYCSNWSFGMPEASVLSSLAQAKENSKFAQEPLIQRADRLSFIYGGMKENVNYGLMLECVEIYFQQKQALRALQIYQNYAYLMTGETISFQEREGFELQVWQNDFSALCKEHLGNDRLNLS